MSTLTVLPSTCQESIQRCLVGPAVFEQLNVPIGSWCIVHHHGNGSICSLWLRDDLQDGFIEIPNSVTLHCQNTESPVTSRRNHTFSIDSIQPVPKPSSCHGITVSVFTDFKHLRNLQQAPREAVTRHVHHQLMGCAVVEGCIISLQTGSQFAGPMISHIVVEECILERASQLDASGITEHSHGTSTSGQEKLLTTSSKLHKPTSLGIKKDVDTDPSIPSSVSDDSQSNLDRNSSDQATVTDKRMDLEVCLITERTEIRIKQIASKESISYPDTQAKFRIGGLDDAASLLRKLIEYPARYPETLGRLGLMTSNGILLRGPPGCGKTSLMKAVADECKVCLLQINGAEIFGASPGESESNIRQIFEKAKAIGETHHCVLFIDELDALCPRRDQGIGTQEARVVAQLLMLMDEVRGQSKVLVVGATSRPNSLDPALRRPGRFDQEVLIGMPSVSQRVSILEAHSQGLHLAENVDLGELAKRCHGFNGADLACLCQQAALHALEKELHATEQEGSTKLETLVVTMNDFIGSLSHVTPSLHRAAGSIIKELQPVSWDAIGGLQKVKAQLRQAVEWPLSHWQSFARLGVRGPSGVLLYGPPGCCKTTLAQAAATACKASFFAVSCAELYSPFVGDSEKILTEVFRKARLTAPSIVFLDELDSLIGGRGTDKGRGLSERLLSCLLVEMDGIGVPSDEEIPAVGDHNVHAEGRVLVVAASNRIDLIDAALLRPGRFDCLIYVPPPDKQARQEILSVYTQRMPLGDGVDIDDLAEVTDMYTGADLEGLCREAGLLALQEHGVDNSESARIHQRHLLSALDWCGPSLTEDLLARYKQTGIQATYEVS